MATTKIWDVKNNLGRLLDYGSNPEKTDLADGMAVALEYAAHADKTERCIFVTGINCEPDTALAEMRLTKRNWNREEPGRAVAFHGIQSFAPGEATPAQAHAVGKEFARRMWGERFEVLVCTHLDKAHLHNHFIINSISFKDGGRYHDNKQSYYGKMRVLSDELCREVGLSVIDEPQGKGKHYAEWQAEREGKHTKRGLLRADIDAAIKAAYTFQDFVEQMRRHGHTVNVNPNRKYITVKPKDAAPTDRAFRLTERSMGAGYSEEDIRARLARQRDGLPEVPRNTPRPTAKPRRRFSDAAAYKPRQHRKMKGFIALYWHYCYFLKVVKHGGKSNKLPVVIRQEVTKLEQYTRRFLYLYRNNITTAEELQAHREGLVQQIADLAEQRRPLYTERKIATEQGQMAALTESINQKTTTLRALRKAKRLCDGIEAQAPEVSEKIRQTEAMMQQKQREKEEPRKDKFRLL